MFLPAFIKRSLRLGSWPLLQRYVVGNRISELPSICLGKSLNFSVHTLLNRKDIMMYEWMLRSLVHYANTSFSVCIHEDGSFTDRDVRYLEGKYPGIKIWRRKEADEKMYIILKDYPALLHYRKCDFWAIKALDVYFLSQAKYMLLVDADVLFFGQPTELFKDDDKNYWMEDVCYMLGISSEDCETGLNLEKLKPMNAGLGRVQRRVVDLDLAERFLKIQAQPVNDMIFHAIFATKYSSITLLNDKYMLKFRQGVDDIIAKHFVNPIRFWFWEEGVPRLAKSFKIRLHHFLKERL